MEFKVDHFGFLTNNIESSLSFYIKLGWTIKKDIIDDFLKLRLVFIENNGHFLELIEPIEYKIISKEFLSKNNNKIYHIAYKVSNLDEAIKLSGARVIPNTRSKANAFDNKEIIFLLSNNGILELINA